MSKDKKTKTTTDSSSTGTTAGTSNVTSIGTAPDWITSALKGVTNNVTSLGAANPQSYVAGANPLQAQAGAAAGTLSGLPWNFDTAATLARGVAGSSAPQTSGVSASGYMGNYQNPWLKNVVNSTLADYDTNAGKTRAQQSLDLAGSGAFGGSGAALTQSATEGELARGRASAESGLLSQGFNTALGAAQQDAGRQQGANDINAQLTGQQQDRTLAAGKQLTDLSTAYDANQRANIGTQAGVGDALRQITQQQATAPLDLASWQSSALPSMLQGLFGKDVNGATTGTTSTQSKGTTKVSDSPSQADQAGQALQTALAVAAMFSDVRLKRDLVKIGQRPDGLDVYEFEYIWGGPRQVGVMAQQAQELRPEIVHTHPSGYLMVDYGSL